MNRENFEMKIWVVFHRVLRNKAVTLRGLNDEDKRVRGVGIQKEFHKTVT